MSDTTTFDYSPFDALLAPDGPVMLVGQQLLQSAAIANDEIVFPPSYANPSEKKDDPPVYNIDPLDPKDPSKNVCVLDSIPSQANRMEPLFGLPANLALVPQYSLRFLDNEEPVSILNIGHRIADAAFRGTTLREAIVSAFNSYAKSNAVPMARIAPTSLVFGAWDSRGTGVKVPRLINSIIRAFNVVPLRRSAQYSPPIKYDQEGLIPAGLEGKPSDHGLADVPSTHTIGGVQINGDIRRDVSLNLSTLRALKGGNGDETTTLQRYILSLSLIALTATPDPNLRQGCQLLPKRKMIWKQFKPNGDKSDWDPTDLRIDDFALAAAIDFGVTQPENRPLIFSKDLLKASIDTDAAKKARKKAKSASNSAVMLQSLVENLKTNKARTKLNDGPAKKLKEHLESITEGDDLKSLADEMLGVLNGKDEPQAKIQQLKDLVANQAAALSEDESNGDVNEKAEAPE